MKASTARALSNSKRKKSFLEYLREGMKGENPEAFLGEAVRAIIDENIRFVTEEGRTAVMMEPFASIPGDLHLADVEDRVVVQLVDQLVKDGYQDVQWDRRDKRVVLQFRW